MEVVLNQLGIKHVSQTGRPDHARRGVDQEVSEVHKVVVVRRHAQLLRLYVHVHEHSERDQVRAGGRVVVRKYLVICATFSF